jgi:phage-related minor tail protein
MDEALDGPVETWTVRVDADTAPLEEQLKVATGLGRQFSSALINAFEGIATKGRSLGEVLKSLALSLSNMVLKAAFRPLEQGFGNLLSGLFSGGFGFAKGAAFQQGLPVPFAKGGVISSPIAFPLARGRTGIAGERGAEAIMPLARGPDGRLGVVAQGGGGIP